MSIETELKLQIDPRHIARLRGHPLFKRATRRLSHKLYSVYYDTPDLDLWHAGITLRLRRTAGRWVQTIKGGGTVAAGLHQRHEFETGITTPIPDFSAIGSGELAAHFASPQLRARLKPMIVTEFTRVSSMLAPAPGVTIEASIDHGIIKCGGATESICELELEVKTGPAWRAYQVAMQLLEAAPLLVEDRSKAERGVALHLGTRYKPLKAPPSPVAAGTTSNSAFKLLVLTCLAHYAANQRGMLAGADPEYLHQMRVALRRLRSVFSTFAPLFPAAVLEPPVVETRWLAQILGAARDWDVFVAETLPPVSTRYAQHPGMAALTRSAAILRKAANRTARRAVVSARGQGLLLALGAWINAETWLEAFDQTQRAEMQRPVSGFAQTVLDAALKRVRKRGRHFANLAPPELHRVRIAAKKLRYATEFFAPLHDGKNARDYQNALARLQDALGSYNDALKMASFAERASRGLRGAAAIEARGIMLGWSGGMQAVGTRHLMRVWKEFRTAKPFWK
ncbi:MAG: CHAD domain-containing protein [Pseudomonadota bacterium]